MDARSSTDVRLFGGLRLDLRRGVLSRKDEDGVFAEMVVGSRALDILCLLVGRPGDLVSRAEIIEAVWPGTVVEDSNLNVQIAALRRVIDQGRSAGSCIQTVPGRGYRFVAAVTAAEHSTPSAAGPGFCPATSDPVPEVAPPQIAAASGGLAGVLAATLGAPRRFWRRAAATLAGAVVLLGAVAAWDWHALRSGGEGLAPRLSIVVLPFANLSADREQQYFADGVTEDLTTDLSRIADSFVISHNTAVTYKDKAVGTKQIGHELGVRYVLEGSIQRSGNKVGVNVQLIDAETDAHVWAERIERDLGDLFALQNEVTGRIAVALNYALVGAEAARPTANPDALDCILRGRAASSGPPTRAVYGEAIGWFERAAALDPQSVAAKSWLALAVTGRVLDDMSTTAATDIVRAQELVQQAIAAAPHSLLAHMAEGHLLRAQHRYGEAIPEYETVIAINRNSQGGYSGLAQSKFYTGSIVEAVPLVEKAIRLSPRDPQIGFWYLQIGRAHLLQSRTEEAVRWLEKARSANPAHPPTHALLAAAYAQEGETKRAALELAEARKLSGDDRYASIARLRAIGYFGVPRVRALYEAVYFAGLRKAGMPED